VESDSDESSVSMFTVHRASTGADWEATALLYDYVEWVRGWTGFDPVVEQPQLDTEVGCLADHYTTDDAVLYLAAWQAIAVGAVAIRVEPDGSAELKRMYVRPVARGRGIADRLIGATVAGATERQCHTGAAIRPPWADLRTTAAVPRPRSDTGWRCAAARRSQQHSWVAHSWGTESIGPSAIDMQLCLRLEGGAVVVRWHHSGAVAG
jgi:GNAT superfamily N-acetyltransferase